MRCVLPLIVVLPLVPCPAWYDELGRTDWQSVPRLTMPTTRRSTLDRALGCAPAPFPKPDMRTDLEKLQGEWICIHESYGGTPRENYEETLSIKGNRMWRYLPRTFPVECTFTLDAKTNLRSFDFKMTDLAGDPVRGVYRLEGDTLTICYHQSVRPPNLSGKQAETFRNVYRRKKS